MINTSRKHIAILVLVGFGIRLWLIFRYPIIFGGDTVLRLVNYEYIVLSYQLPLLQSIVHYLHALTPDPLWVRVVMSAIGAIAGVGFYLLATQLVSARAAFYGALVFTLHPFILPLSTVPYQEILMITGLLFAFYGAIADRPIVASIGLAVACFTRYESWLACPVVAWAYLDRRSFSARHLGEALLLFGWAPLAWIAYNGGAVTPPGSFAVETRFTAARLVRWAFVGYVALRNTPWPVLLLAIVGLAVISLRRGWRDRRYLLLAAYLGLFLVALLFSAHGTLPDPERRVTDREAHIPMVGIVLLATLGINALRRFQASAVAVCAAISLWMSLGYLTAQTTEPRLALAVETAHYLDRSVGPGDQVAVLAPPIEKFDYVRRAGTKGETARAAALRIVNTLETTPPDYQRILVHSRLGKDRLRSYATLLGENTGRNDTLVRPHPLERLPQWIVRWADFRASNDQETQLGALVQPLHPVWTRTDGGVEVSLYRMDSLAR